MKIIGLIGHPVAHSVSPRFQQAALLHAGIEAAYESWDTLEEELPQRMERLRQPDALGANVTVPHKSAVLDLLDHIDASASIPGAVNVIVNDRGRLSGYNTDGSGLVAALRKEAGFDPLGARFLVVGAGGAARGIAFALARAEAEAVLVTNRTVDRTMDLTESLHRAYPGCEVQAVAWSRRDAALGQVNALIHCTTVGMEGGEAEGESPVDLSAAPSGLLVVDIVYNPLETPLLREARDRDLPVLDGVAMLVHQGAEGFRLWTGREPDTGVMFEAAYEALGAGGESH